MIRSGRTGDRGFTLVEVLVVMILVGMIVTVLFQGLSQAVRIRTSAGLETAQIARDAMRRTWYRQLINGLAPSDDNETTRFQGGPKSFAGQSTNPIDIDTGAVLPVTVSLDVDGTTNSTVVNVATSPIATNPHVIALLVLPGTNYSFSYVDDDGSRSDAWPRRAIAKPPQLPSAIWLVDRSDNRATELLAASIMGPRNAPPGPSTVLQNQP